MSLLVMVRPNWEYARLTYELRTNWATRAKRGDGSWEDVTFQQTYYWSSPGEPELKEIPGDDLLFLDLLNRYGADGWELVSEAPYENTIATSRLGWSTTGASEDTWLTRGATRRVLAQPVTGRSFRGSRAWWDHQRPVDAGTQRFPPATRTSEATR